MTNIKDDMDRYNKNSENKSKFREYCEKVLKTFEDMNKRKKSLEERMKDKDVSKYKNHLAKKKGFESITDYQKHQAKKNEFESLYEQQKDRAKKKGFETLEKAHNKLFRYRNKLIIFEEIVDRITKKPERNMVLFGEVGYVVSKEKYDLLFHLELNVNLSRIEGVTSMVVPVLSKENKNKSDLVFDMYKLFSKDNRFDMFAVPDKEDLDFYLVTSEEYGKDIKSIDRYFKVNEQEFFKGAKNKRLEDDLKKKREIISQKDYAKSRPL